MTIPEHMARFILDHDLCVMATSSPDGAPHASLMSYAALPDLRYIYMATPANTRKWANLSANPEMAVLLDERELSRPGERDRSRSLTVSGRHDPLDDRTERHAALEFLTGKHPELGRFLYRPGTEIIRLRPLVLTLMTGAENAEFIDLRKNEKIA